MGASDALRDRVGLTLTGAEADLYDETAERLRLALGDQRNESDRAVGRSMPSDDVIEFARAAVTQ